MLTAAQHTYLVTLPALGTRPLHKVRLPKLGSRSDRRRQLGLRSGAKPLTGLPPKRPTRCVLWTAELPTVKTCCAQAAMRSVGCEVNNGLQKLKDGFIHVSEQQTD